LHGYPLDAGLMKGDVAACVEPEVACFIGQVCIDLTSIVEACLTYFYFGTYYRVKSLANWTKLGASR
jgi:hypothetical protein